MKIRTEAIEAAQLEIAANHLRALKECNAPIGIFIQKLLQPAHTSDPDPTSFVPVDDQIELSQTAHESEPTLNVTDNVLDLEMNKSNINQLRKAIGKEALLDLMEVKSGGAAHASNPVTENDAEQLARTFHEVYERLAPDFGYETRKETREFDPTTPNGKLMIAVCRELLSEPWRRKPAHASDPRRDDVSKDQDFGFQPEHASEVYTGLATESGDGTVRVALSQPAHASEPEWPDFQELLNAAVEAGELRQGDADYVMGLLETSFRSRASMAHASERIKMVDHASEQGADTKRLMDTLLEMIPRKSNFGGAGEAYGILTNIIIQAKNVRAAMSQTK